MKEGGGGEDHGKNAHCNEVISALAADEGNLGVEEDADLEDLYGDLDLQSLKSSNMEEREMKTDPAAGASSVSTAYERGGVGNQGSGLPAQSGRNMNKNDTGVGGTVTDAGAVRVLGCYGGQRVVFVQELNYWTTDAEVETEVFKYGMVKEVNFFEEKESGKSKGTCKVKFYDSGAAAACQAGMNGHVFHGRPCVVSFSPPQECRTQETGEVVVSKPPEQMSLGRGQGGSDSNNGQGMGNRGDARMRSVAPPPPQMMMMHSMARGLNPALGRRMGDYGLGGCMPRPVSGMMQPPTPVWRMMQQPFRPPPPPPPVWGMPGYVVSNVNPSFIGRGMWHDRTSTPNVQQHHGNGQGTGSQLRVTRQANDRHRSVSVSLHSLSRDRERSDTERERDGEEDRKRRKRDEYMRASDSDDGT